MQFTFLVADHVHVIRPKIKLKKSYFLLIYIKNIISGFCCPCVLSETASQFAGIFQRFSSVAIFGNSNPTPIRWRAFAVTFGHPWWTKWKSLCMVRIKLLAYHRSPDSKLQWWVPVIKKKRKRTFQTIKSDPKQTSPIPNKQYEI